MVIQHDPLGVDASGDEENLPIEGKQNVVDDGGGGGSSTLVETTLANDDGGTDTNAPGDNDESLRSRNNAPDEDEFYDALGTLLNGDNASEQEQESNEDDDDDDDDDDAASKNEATTHQNQNDCSTLTSITNISMASQAFTPVVLTDANANANYEEAGDIENQNDNKCARDSRNTDDDDDDDDTIIILEEKTTTTTTTTTTTATAARPMSDIEQAIDLLAGSCERGHATTPATPSTPTPPSTPTHEDEEAVVASNQEDGDDISQYYSCSSTCMAVQPSVVTAVVTPRNKQDKMLLLNDTMKTSTHDSEEETVSGGRDDDEGGGGGGGASAFLHRSIKPSRGGSSRHAPWCVTTNHRRNVIAATIISVAFIVLVGLGLGLSSKKEGNVDTANEAAIVIDDVADAAAEYSMVPSNDPSDSPSSKPTDEPTNEPTTEEPTNEPSTMHSTTPSISPSILSSSSPSNMPLTPTSTPSRSTNPTYTPSSTPSITSSDSPSSIPSQQPTLIPTLSPTASPSTSNAPTKQFIPGDLTLIDTDLNIRMSSGLSVKLIATTGERPRYANGKESNEKFHGMMDGAGIVELSNGRGYVYVSNSEISSGDGGVYGLYFDEAGSIVNYKTLLDDTTRNCGGGLSPWNTWISCEETTGGQCWQVDPDPEGVYHESPMETLLGGDGGRYETVACDNRNPDRPIFFTTEDHEYGALRRFEADSNGWDALHTGGTTTFLRIMDDSTFQWTTNEFAAKNSAVTYYRNAEGVIYHEGLLYFVAKKTRTLFILNLATMTYESERTGDQFSGKGSFNAQPDQVVLGENFKRWIYFTEDGGSSPGVYVRDVKGTYYTIFEAMEGSRYSGLGGDDPDETVGIALSPDRRKLYAGFQDAGLLMEFTRDDGFPFE